MNDAQEAVICRALYLDLLKHCLINTIYEDVPIVPTSSGKAFDRESRYAGRDWPSGAHTMIGMKRLDNIQSLMEDLLIRNVPGDFIETGVWRGGATIFMRGVLKAYGVTDRTVWVADSFIGLPLRWQVSLKSYTSPEFAQLQRPSESVALEQFPRSLACLRRGTSLAEVQTNFSRYNLLDQQVRFLPGWFQETLRDAPLSNLALVRIDCDLYDSTYQCLENLYKRLTRGGYVIVDDYYSLAECCQAVHDFLEETGDRVDIIPVDQDAVFWKKP